MSEPDLDRFILKAEDVTVTSPPELEFPDDARSPGQSTAMEESR